MSSSGFLRTALQALRDGATSPQVRGAYQETLEIGRVTPDMVRSVAGHVLALSQVGMATESELDAVLEVAERLPREVVDDESA